MWYVVQTAVGDEEKIKEILYRFRDKSVVAECFIIRCECVRRSGGRNNVRIENLFPGYVFIETEDPAWILEAEGRITEFVHLLGVEKSKKGTFITPVSKEDKDFIESITDDDHLMKISRIKVDERNRIEEVRGPLSPYQSRIVKFEYRHRLAIVETKVFGEKRRIRFFVYGMEDAS